MKLFHGDCLAELKRLDKESVDALVTDPPAGIGFMNKEWDHHKGGRSEWIAWLNSVMRECYRVMKPGAHGLVWSIPRTSHWTATALEDAGFEVRDRVSHIFGTGFPKSHNLKGEGDGWGTALKPACEDWWLIRKPCSEKTVAANVIEWGTGALNIDASRIENLGKSTARITNAGIAGNNFAGGKTLKGPMGGGHELGRFPSHLIFDEESARLLDEQSLAGGMHSAGAKRKKIVESQVKASSFEMSGARQMNRFGDLGGASRFFYVAKTSKAERNAGCDENKHPTVKPQKLMQYLITMITPPGGTVLDPFMGSGSTGVAAIALGFGFVGIEQDIGYMAIAEARIAHTLTQLPQMKLELGNMKINFGGASLRAYGWIRSAQSNFYDHMV